jgi:hypothetical protein
LGKTSKNVFDYVSQMENSADRHRTLLVISIWTETLPSKQPAWRGSIRTIDGKRISFNTLAGLNRLLYELTGWHDTQMGSIMDLQRE